MTHYHYSAITKDGKLVEMNGVVCADGWFGVYDHWGDGGNEGDRHITKFKTQRDAFLWVYDKLKRIHGEIIPMVFAYY